MKKFRFVNEAAAKDFRALPKEIQRQFGLDLTAVQHGGVPFSAYKHIQKSVGPGAIELIENGSPAYRAVYCAKFEDTVYLLHAFTKTTNGVDKKAMNTASERYKEMLRQIKENKGAGR
ncbi:type II toxin-antitoxin system RelE/ParE family toxin [Sinorhizobium chiapasense]|uniref:Type II toxin-antitoxin system RelE/ParE family toxin n=1 Tax=Sinorhizobium chiapasense TaxID=501572 RepID=A0ABZ2BLK1_9HYPH